jgi:methylamine---glutamate N-methyltransferase subunit A
VCGIVGLHLIDPELHPRLGELLTPMLVAMSTRGPDSSGIAVYDEPLTDGRMRYTVRAGSGDVWTPYVTTALGAALGCGVELKVTADHATLTTAADEPGLRDALRELVPDAVIVGWGRSLRIVKDVGTPAEIADRYGLAAVSGYQGVGHTRMATESAVTTDHSHPFAPAADLTLVHNGSFSNYASIRRRLIDAGDRFETDNDSEVAARFIARRLAAGDDLGEALRRVLKEFDGFFTLLVASRDQFAVVRDAFACKPLVVAETPAYVAVTSEYHAMAGLPGIERARVFEPMPEEIHVWSR